MVNGSTPVKANVRVTGWIYGWLQLLRTRALIKLRQPLGLTFEILIPILALLIMVPIRNESDVVNEPTNLYVNDARELTLNSTGGQFLAELENFNDFVAFAPASDSTVIAIQNRFAQLLSDLGASETIDRRLRFFPSAQSIEDYVLKDGYPSPSVQGMSAAIILNSGSPNYRYTIRMNFTDEQEREAAVKYYGSTVFVDKFDLVFDRAYERYISRGFIFLQMLVESVISSPSADSVFAVPFPVPAFKKDSFADAVGYMIGVLIAFGYLLGVTRMSKSIMEEKEARIRELLKVVGVSEFALFFSWFLIYACIIAVQALLVVLIVQPGLYAKSSSLIVFLLFWLFGLSTFAYCYMLSAFFTRQRVAAIFTALIFIGMSFTLFALQSDNTTQSTKEASCLLPPVCAGQILTVLTKIDSSSSASASLNNLYEEFDNFAVGIGLSYLALDIAIYALLGAYFMQVLPSTYGVQEKPWFCFLPSYWKRMFGIASGPSAHDVDVGHQEAARARDEANRHKFEPVASGSRGAVGLSVRNLVKVFSTAAGPTRAVDGLSVDMFEGEIFCLLGHNGAGKTTTMNMLTGFYQPTSGDAIINGMSIRSDMPAIRKSIGMCPQHDALYPLLTVSEHLYLHAGLKLDSAEEAKKQVDEMINAVGLTEKAHARSSSLSGGQKRKLSIAMALIGNAKTVFLDEPTSGMDAYSRRWTWSLIQQKKAGRTIVLTTHFMDEADSLGDRIGIMAHGALQCCGTSLFLKQVYGVGYILTVSKTIEVFNERRFLELLSKHTKNPTILSNVAGEISYRLAFADSKAFPEMFDGITARKNELGVVSFGISVTTLEEVFLRVGQGDDQTEAEKRISQRVSISNPNDASIEMKELHINTSAKNLSLAHFERVDDPTQLFMMHLGALLKKRFHAAKRDRKVVVWTLVYPTILLALGMLLLLASRAFKANPVTFTTETQYENPDPVIVAGPNVEFLNNMLPPSVISPIEPTGSEPYNVTGFSRYLLDTREEEKRYGAFLAVGSPESRSVFMFFNTSAYHSLPTYLNQLTNARIRSDPDRAQQSVELINAPFPLTKRQRTLNDSLLALIVSIAFAFVPATYVAFVVREREENFMHQQLISGVSKTAYWLSNWIWDCINMAPPIIVSLILIQAFRVDALIGSENFSATIILMVLYALSVTPFTYAMSFLFTDPSTAQNVVLFFYDISGSVLLIAYIVMTIIESTRDAAKIMVWFISLIPSFAFGLGISSLMVRTAGVAGGGVSPAFDWDIVGKPALYMALSVPFYFGIIALIEYVRSQPEAIVSRAWRMIADLGSSASKQGSDEDTLQQAESQDDDEDVRAEANRVLKAASAQTGSKRSDQGDMIQVLKLTKRFGPKRAVRGVTFGVPKGECFGFLGVNGAGKTTTLRMLTSDELPSSGTARLGGFDILHHQAEVRNLIGFCPQFSSLVGTLTAREHFHLFAAIKGVPVGEKRDKLVQSLIYELGLSEYADKMCDGYSGGNKRKVSVGISLVGDPAIVFLDEPSTGMDPSSRRNMWNVISRTMASRSVILTTHSMEECEALCGRIAIMVSGRLKCIGSSQHLKQRYGDCYQLEVNVRVRDNEMNPAVPESSKEQASLEDATKRVRSFVEASFDAACLLERQGANMKFSVGKTKTLADVFRIIEGNRNKLSISEYAVSDMSLEQIFISFARHQEEEKATAPGVAVELQKK